jgi:ribosome-associated heat shock protein Hsp15
VTGRKSLDRQRVDKWLWHARVVRTRSAAAALVGAGLVRINGAREAAPSRPVRPGDVLTIALDRSVRVLRVKGYAERRGSAEIARALYDDLSPPAPAAVSAPLVGMRDEGAGRPTKRERRETDRLKGRNGFE